MATKNLVPRGSGEGGIGVSSKPWGDAYFDSGHFNKGLYVSGVAVSTGDVGGLGGKWEDAATAGDIYYNGGNVGIGTTNPDARLEVKDTDNHLQMRIGSLSSAISPVIRLQGKNDNNTTNRYADIKLDAENGVLTLLAPKTTAPNINAINVKQGGNVGIGTTSPDAKLEVAGGINFSGNIIPVNNDAFDIGSADKKVRDLYLGSNSLHIGGGTISSNNDERIQFHSSGILIGEALLIPDPSDPDVLYFPKAPQVEDAEGNPVSLLSADKLGLGTSEVTQTDPGDIKFKLLTDENRFIVGTTGEGNLQSGWYRFNDFQVKGATDIGSHSINPVDTRIYADQESFILFKNDTAGRKVAHLVAGAEEVSANNALALGISIKTDSSENPEDIEFTHTDGESYSLINGDSDSVGVNGLPVRQGFQPVSLGANPSPLLIDGGSF